MKIEEKEIKSIITKSNLPDADYVINPYIGCQHGCIYCYADFMKRFTGHTDEQWGTFVDVKINAAQTIKNIKHINRTILIGSVTDPYQQVEGKFSITKEILSSLLKFQPSIEILTKSALISRDFAMLSKFNNLTIGISLNSLDRKISREIEPYASSPSARINTLKRAYDLGIKAYAFISPIFPQITNYKEIVQEVKPYVHKILFENLNVRGNNKVKILEYIDKNFPDLSNFYNTLSANRSYWNNLEKEIEDYCISQKIDYKIYFNHSTDKKK